MSLRVNQSPAFSGVSEVSGKLHLNNRPIFSMLVFPKVTPCHFRTGIPPHAFWVEPIEGRFAEIGTLGELGVELLAVS